MERLIFVLTGPEGFIMRRRGRLLGFVILMI
jgi:hypothetical protein